MDRPLNYTEAVKNLQRYLRKISYYEKDLRRVPIDGIFDTDTEGAVKEFQALSGMTPNGIVDKDTWDAIFKRYRELTANESIRIDVPLFSAPPEQYDLYEGDTRNLVYILQVILVELAAIYDELEDVAITGRFDTNTKNAVLSFQKANLLKESGVVDTPTWNALLRAYGEYGNAFG